MHTSGEAGWTVGVDEAGYGPNLGPLVVAATAWRGPPDGDPGAALQGAVSRDAADANGRLLIADSKQAYSPGGGLARLERAVYAATSAPSTWRSLIDRVGAGHVDGEPWTTGFDPALPIDADPSDVTTAERRLVTALDAAGFAPPVVAARRVGPREFNTLVAEHGTKGAALSHISIGLARRVFDRAADPTSRWSFVFDKHGGRNRYAGLLQHHFPETWIEALHECRAESAYRAGDRMRFRFRSRGEEELPVALASMTAKLLREIEMHAFNAFWRRRLPHLKPTAGYPVDAKRFKAEIAAEQAALGIADTVLWRER